MDNITVVEICDHDYCRLKRADVANKLFYKTKLQYYNFFNQFMTPVYFIFNKVCQKQTNKQTYY